MRYITLFVLLYLQVTISYGQSEHTLGFMENVFQSTYSNPTAMPQHKVSIGLPGISSTYLGLTNTGFTYNHLMRQDGLVDISNAISKMGKKNYVFAGASMDLFHLRVKARNSFFSFNVRDNINARFSYPKPLMSLAWNGNYQFAGSEVNLKSLGFDATYYREYALGYAKEGKVWDFAGRVKLLQGFANASTRAKQLGLSVDEEYFDLAFTSDATLNTGGIDYDMDYGNDSLMGGIVTDYMRNFRNRGAALDFGVTYKYNDKWHFSGSINNLGFIRWKDNVVNHNVKGGTTFEGLDYNFFNSDSMDVDLLDSLKNAFVYTESNNPYTSWVVPQLYLRAKYNLTKTTTFNGAISFEKYKAIRTSVTLGATQELGRVFNVLLTYTYQYRNFDNVGLGLMFKPGPFQFYFVSDYLIRTYPYDNTNPDKFRFSTGNAKTFNFRFGMNLVFGRIRDAEKQTGPLR